MGQRRVPRLVDERPGRRAGVVRAVRVTQQRRLQRRQRLADERRGVRGARPRGRNTPRHPGVQTRSRGWSLCDRRSRTLSLSRRSRPPSSWPTSPRRDTSPTATGCAPYVCSSHTCNNASFRDFSGIFFKLIFLNGKWQVLHMQTVIKVQGCRRGHSLPSFFGAKRQLSSLFPRRRFKRRAPQDRCSTWRPFPSPRGTRTRRPRPPRGSPPDATRESTRSRQTGALLPRVSHPTDRSLPTNEGAPSFVPTPDGAPLGSARAARSTGTPTSSGG